MYGNDAEVRLHVYDLDQVSGWLNATILKPLDLGVFHVGVEVYSAEWSFQYFEDVWEDDSLSGILSNKPAKHPMFIYRETISMGQTPLSISEVWTLVFQMMELWPANSYHLTQRNCICFAEEFCKALRLPTKFPEWTAGVAAFSNKFPPLRSAVNFGWTTAKNWMIAKCREEHADGEDDLSMPMCATQSVAPYVMRDSLRCHKRGTHSLEPRPPLSPVSVPSPSPRSTTEAEPQSPFLFDSGPTVEPRFFSGGSVSSACPSPTFEKGRRPRGPSRSTSSTLHPLCFGGDSDPSSVSDDEDSIADEGFTQRLDWTTPSNPGAHAIAGDLERQRDTDCSTEDGWLGKVDSLCDGFSVADEGRRWRIEATPCRRSDVKDGPAVEEGMLSGAPCTLEAATLAGTDDVLLYGACMPRMTHRDGEFGEERRRSSPCSRTSSGGLIENLKRKMTMTCEP